MEDKVTIKALVSSVIIFEDSGHLTMKNLRNKVHELLEPSGAKIKDIRLTIVNETNNER